MGHAEPRATGLLSVTVAYSPRAGVVEEVALSMRAGATVADALRDSGLLQRHAIDAGATAVGVWGALVDAQTLLRDRDRVEIYRPLRVDPKQARRLRQQKQRNTPKR